MAAYDRFYCILLLLHVERIPNDSLGNNSTIHEILVLIADELGNSLNRHAQLVSGSRGSNLLSDSSPTYSKTCVILPLSKRPKIGFQVQLLLNEGQRYCKMLQREHSAILLTIHY